MATYTISNILSGPTALLHPIDNSDGKKKIAIKSITVWIGWYNTNKDSWMAIVRRIDLGGDDNDPNTGIAVGDSKHFTLRPGLLLKRQIQ